MNEGIIAAALERSPHPCAYLPGEQADFEHYWLFHYDDGAFCELLESGFRRFGAYFFRPSCATAGARCGACLPLRVPVASFQPSRSQRRVLRRGGEIALSVQRPQYSEEKYELYLRHKQRFNQPEAGRSAESADETEIGSSGSFRQSFYTPNPFTWECEYHLGDRLVGVGLMDVASRLLSSIYFYFDPAFTTLSLGTLSVLCEIDLARAHGIPFYYLGYTIQACPAMRYKTDFRPCEIHDGRRWRILRDGPGRFMLDWENFKAEPFAPLAIQPLQLPDD